MIDLRRRTPAVLLAVVIGHLALISLQVTTSSGVRVFEGVVFGLFSEVQRGVARMVGGVAGLWDGYVGLLSVQNENDALRESVADLEFRLQQVRAQASRAQGLEKLLGFRSDVGYSTVPARVIAGPATLFSRTVTIDRGTSDGVRRDSAVLSSDGVVGRVVGNPGSRAAKVQLLVDRLGAAGALIDRTRAAGVVKGGGDQGLLLMEYVSNLSEVQVGDIVVTSGIDGIYPKGFLIGVVEVAQRGSSFYRTIHVRPQVKFSDIEDVLVIIPDPATSTPAAGGE